MSSGFLPGAPIAALLAVSLVIGVATSSAATMTGWDIGWNDMATLSGGTVESVVNPETGALKYINITQANMSFATYDFFDGYFASYGETYSWGADAFNDLGQHFFDGAIRNSWYDGAVPDLTAYDWDGSNGQPAVGTYEWLINNYNRDGSGNPIGAPKNSHVRGTGSSFTYDLDTGDFVANMASSGTWYWYTLGTADSQMSDWIRGWDHVWDQTGDDFAAYHDRYMTGNFRMIGTFEDQGGLPTFSQATLQYQVAVPEPGTAGLMMLGGVALGGWALLRGRRRSR